MNNYISSPTGTLGILKKNNIILRKTLGQNFLVDTNILKKIVRASGASKDDIVLEIGSGIGSLTEILAPQAKKVICIEIDSKLINAFKENFTEPPRALLKEKILIINEDAMKSDFARLNEQNRLSRVVSNLPYKVAAPLIIKILVQMQGLKNMLLTIQKDIAERLLSKPGDKYYSSYCVKANYLADLKILFAVPRSCFFPVPNIDSVVVEVIPKDISDSKIGPELLGRFFNFIEYCFIHRRKKLVNSLIASSTLKVQYGQDIGNIDKKDLIVKMLHGIGKGADIRAEYLSLQEFERLFLSIYRYLSMPEKIKKHDNK